MTAKQRFNRKHGLPPNETNSKADISRMTGITVKKLDEIWDKAYKEYRYADISKKVPRGAFAMGSVYLYALENARWKRKK